PRVWVFFTFGSSPTDSRKQGQRFSGVLGYTRSHRCNHKANQVWPYGLANRIQKPCCTQMSCNLHSYSHGRLVLGLGAGWYREEYEAKGFEFPTLKDRHDQLIEAL